jgi:hypothetical protein
VFAFCCILAGVLAAEVEAKYFEPFISGFWTTVVLECANTSLQSAPASAAGDTAVVAGPPVEVARILEECLGAEHAAKCLSVKSF